MPTLNSATIDILVFRRDISRRALFLLLRHAQSTRYAGLWRVLTGQAAEGETAVAAAMRAVREHTGLRVTTLWVLDHAHTYYDPQDDLLHVNAVLAVEVEDATTTLSPEYDDVRWITVDQTSTLLRWPGHREGVQRVQEDIFLSDDRGAPFRVESHG